MEKNINLIFAIDDLLTSNQEVIEAKNFREIINKIIFDAVQDQSIKVYFLINEKLEETDDNTLKSIQKEKIKKMLSDKKIKIKNNDIYFLTKKLNDNEIDNSTKLNQIIKESNEFYFSKNDTIVLFSDIYIGQSAFYDGFYTVFLDCPTLNYDGRELRDIKRLSSSCIKGDVNKMSLDFIKYDFISFLENK